MHVEISSESFREGRSRCSAAMRSLCGLLARSDAEAVGCSEYNMDLVAGKRIRNLNSRV